MKSIVVYLIIIVIAFSTSTFAEPPKTYSGKIIKKDEVVLVAAVIQVGRLGMLKAKLRDTKEGLDVPFSMIKKIKIYSGHDNWQYYDVDNADLILRNGKTYNIEFSVIGFTHNPEDGDNHFLYKSMNPITGELQNQKIKGDQVSEIIFD